MLNFIFRIVLTVNATSWLIVIYGVKEKWEIGGIPFLGTTILLLAVPVLMTFISIGLAHLLGSDNVNECKECVLADNEFLPVYLGYFFVALSINNIYTLVIIYAIIFLFTFSTQALYFNPLFILMGYHFYHIITGSGTRIFVIAKGSIIKNASDADLEDLKRVNDTTYIVMKG